MIENLINLIKENAGDLIVNNQAIANEGATQPSCFCPCA